jgi:hypothetical protein
VRVDEDDLRGGQEREGTGSRVWVIAETTELPTRYVKIVVTDDEGRYRVPDLPEASSYQACSDPISGRVIV